MERATDGCPYPESERAGKCESCCAANGGLPPCALSWLANRLRTEVNITVLRRRETAKAA